MKTNRMNAGAFGAAKWRSVAAARDPGVKYPELTDAAHTYAIRQVPPSEGSGYVVLVRPHDVGRHFFVHANGDHFTLPQPSAFFRDMKAAMRAVRAHRAKHRGATSRS